MSLNLFGKVYLAPDYLYDNGYNRIIFSQERNQAEYLSYDSFNMAGLNTSVLLSKASVNDIVGEEPDQYQSFAHYLKHLLDSNFEGRIYADDDSWIVIFYYWVKIAFPNIDNDQAFVIYNLFNQRENLVFPDDRGFNTFMTSRYDAKNERVILTKQQFLDKFLELNNNDTATSDYYAEIRESFKPLLPVEIQLASYLSGSSNISILSDKIKRIGSKKIFSILDDIRDYIRENILNEKIKTLTGVNLSFEDQDWLETLTSSSQDMQFLFNYSVEALENSYDYRLENIDMAISWCRWITENTVEEDKNDPELGDIILASEWACNHEGCFSSNTEISTTAIEAFLQEDINFSGTTLAFQDEYTRDRINTFWIEYVYQMAKANDVVGLSKVSHT